MRTLTPEQRRPFGTCVAAGPAQFLDQQTCEPVNPHPQPEAPHAAPDPLPGLRAPCQAGEATPKSASPATLKGE